MFAQIVASIVLLTCLSQVEGQSVANSLSLRFYTGQNQFESYNVENLHTIVSHPSFSNARDTVFYHYGFTQSDTSDTVVALVNAYNSRGTFNFVLIHYSSATTNIVTNAREIADNLANAYIRLVRAGFPASRLHLVGFSLGAQIQAIASRNVQSRTNREIVVGRLTGLDPGQIQAILRPLLGRLSSRDATFVDSVHTESVGFGDSQSIGHVNFVVNGGVAQPFCSSIINTIAQACSHNFAVTVWAEAVRSGVPIFPALQCSSWNNFLNNQCNSATVGHLGPFTPSTLRSSFFLRTNNVAPFSRAQAAP